MVFCGCWISYKICRNVLYGCNEAFIIPASFRNETKTNKQTKFFIKDWVLETHQNLDWFGLFFRYVNGCCYCFIYVFRICDEIQNVKLNTCIIQTLNKYIIFINHAMSINWLCCWFIHARWKFSITPEAGEIHIIHLIILQSLSTYKHDIFALDFCMIS